MKKTNLKEIRVTKEGVDEFINDIRNVVTDIVSGDMKYMKPGYGVTTIRDQVTGEVIDFVDLGDSTDSRKEVIEYEIFGQKIQVPVLVSRYAVPTASGDKIEEIKTLGYNDAAMVAKSLSAIYELALFANNFIEVPLRGLHPEVQGLPLPQGSKLPMFGKGFLSVWTGIVPPNQPANAEVAEAYKKASDVLHLHNAVLKRGLDERVSMYRFLGNFLAQNKNPNSNNFVDIVGKTTYSPTVNMREVKTVDATTLNKVVDPFNGVTAMNGTSLTVPNGK